MSSAPAQSEFSIIKQYFEHLTIVRDDVHLGIGDDCALLGYPADQVLAVSIDTLVEGVHFFSDVDPETLGHKSLAVGLSDLAAMGAQPAWFTLALTLPNVNHYWLNTFSKGLASLARQHNIQLVGGDTTRGPLTISIQVHGFVDKHQALRRSGAQAGDHIYVTGTLGDAGAELKIKSQQLNQTMLNDEDTQYLFNRLQRPTPRVDIGQKLLGIASSAIDISDGLIADLNHILQTSGVGAQINIEQLPLSSALTKIKPSIAQQLALTSGDDYELCFTVPADKVVHLEHILAGEYTHIGVITNKTALSVIDSKGKPFNLTGKGYDHFST